MRRVFLVSSVTAILALVNSTVYANTWYDGICLDNTANTSSDPHAQTNGLFWI